MIDYEKLLNPNTTADEVENLKTYVSGLEAKVSQYETDNNQLRDVNAKMALRLTSQVTEPEGSEKTPEDYMEDLRNRIKED